MTVIIRGKNQVTKLSGDARKIILGATLGGTPPVNNYFHDQPTASTTWTINHNLGFFPQTQTFNAGGLEIFGEILNTNINQTVVTFILPISGYARLN